MIDWKLSEEDEKNYEMIRTLEYIHEHINAIENVYYREHSFENIYPEYILEKLDTCEKLIKMEKDYWTKKLKEGMPNGKK